MSEVNEIDLSGDKGVLKEILQNGTGDNPYPGCTVSMHYTGELTDGTVFDASVNRQPFEFQLGRGSVIKAFEIGALSMKLGEKCKLTCAPEYAYGSAGSPPTIPPNATLIFKLEMLGWKGEDISPNGDNSIERVIIEATDKKPCVKDGVLTKVHVIGKYDGKIFEEREVEFDYGEGNAVGIIEGVEIALEKMAVGETSRLKIHGKYAFGNEGKEEFGIPPNAVVEYTVKLIGCEKGIEEWKLTDEERFEQSKIYKEKGTAYFKKENFSLALKMYTKSIDILSDKYDASSGNEEVMQLKIAVHSNRALCYQKMNRQFEGKTACNEVLKLDATNIKALYRRGQCNLAVNEYKEAMEDFQTVIELDPTNKAAVNQIEICKYKIKESNDKEKKIYANMFAKFAAADKQPITNSEPDVLAKCGEWTDEDAAREADLAFERDNNIVMI